MQRRSLCGVSVLLAYCTILLAGSVNAKPVFARSDLSGIVESKLAGVSLEIRSLFLPQSASTPYKSSTGCKVYPGDADWPSDVAWTSLNTLTEGKLLSKPAPHASVCYAGPLFDQSKCNTLTAAWNLSYTHFPDPIEMMTVSDQGLTCTPPAIFDSGNCTRGGYPLYVINATKTEHVQAGVNFARNTGVRLVVRNTGHDFLGKSGGKDALSIYTNNFKTIEYVESYSDPVTGYVGPAFKNGAGVQAFEVYKAAHDKGLTVVGGEGMTVGVMGGYIQGGGHSPLSSLYGMGADQILSMDVVTAAGDFVTANSTSNTDLYWALRGGGGSTFGVATSVTVKAFPEMITTASRFSFSSEKVGQDKFWAGLRKYLNYFLVNADAGTYGYWLITKAAATNITTFAMGPFFAPGKTWNQTAAILQPWLNDLSTLGISFDPNITEFNSVYAAWQSSFPLETVGKINGTTGSRLFPRANFATDAKKDELIQNVRLSVDNYSTIVGFNMKNTDPSNADNAVNSAWRESVFFAQQGVRWNASSPVANRLKIRHDFQAGQMQRWRDISPGAGAYMNEADIIEPNFGQAFWGTKYPRLLQLKAKLDPFDVFYAVTSVGSERWKVITEDGWITENGKLCRVDGGTATSGFSK